MQNKFYHFLHQPNVQKTVVLLHLLFEIVQMILFLPIFDLLYYYDILDAIKDKKREKLTKNLTQTSISLTISCL
jgi:Na+/phosphate symporter